MSRNILCVIEFDRYPDIVVERATWLASSHDCNLHLQVCDPVTEFLGESYVYLFESQDIAESLRAYQEETLTDLVARVEESGVRVEVNRSRERHVSDVIRREAAARQPLFVVKGTHFHTPSERASLDSADWDLIRDLDYALWFVKPLAWKDSPVIVAAVDPVNANDKPANLDRRIIDLARMIAENCKGEIQVLHTYQRLEEIGQRATWAFKPVKLPVDDLEKKIHEEHKKALDSLADSTNVHADVLHLLPGRAHEILPAFAIEQDASLVVMGALARSKMRQRIIGSTAARALDHIHCDVLVAHGKRA
jgi:universal stress protein E